jgi:hypothetical protein
MHNREIDSPSSLAGAMPEMADQDQFSREKQARAL